MGTEIVSRRYPMHRPNAHRLQADRNQHSEYDNMSERYGSVPVGPSPKSNLDGSTFLFFSSKLEPLQRFAGLGIGLASVCAEHLLSHPCVSLRRQCQVHHDSQWFHLTPFTLFPVIANLQRNQSLTTLWKGIGSTFMVKCMLVSSETLVSEVTPLPKEVTRHSSVKKLAEHLLLKVLSLTLTTPLYAANLVETVQSEIASERPGTFDCLREAMSRMVGWSAPQTTRLLPVWKLVCPFVIYGASHYIISSIAKYTVTLTMQTEMMEDRVYDPTEEQPPPKTMYETYYPELLATFTGSLLADMCTYPMETILHRMCVQGTRTIIDNTDTGLDVVPIITRYEGAVDCFRSIMMEEGLCGFYKGFGALVIQYSLHVFLLKVTKWLFEHLTVTKNARTVKAPPLAPVEITINHPGIPGFQSTPYDSPEYMATSQRLPSHTHGFPPMGTFPNNSQQEYQSTPPSHKSVSFGPPIPKF